MTGAAGLESPAPGGLGIVIPTLNEEHTLPFLLDDLSRLPLATRIVVADGGSTDRTAAVAREAGARLVLGPRGRGPQMNVGAEALDTPWLLFLHADSRLPAASRDALVRWLDAPLPGEAAHFAFRLDANGWRWGAIERGQRVRERLTGLVYGDQGLLLSRRRWREVGGMPDLPIMEDVAMVRRLRKTGGLDRIPAPVVTSARRYREEGLARGWLRNVLLLGLYGVGVPPRRLVEWYRPPRPIRTASPEDGPEPILIVFAKAPRVGRVKTRLAVDLGDEAAAALYRTMGRAVLDRLRGGPYRIRVHFDPPDAGPEVERWLGAEGIELRPQRRGDLGERMSNAFDEAFEETDRVCIVGTDSPDLDQDHVTRALELVRRPHAAVFGPALDGGYYLLALGRPAPELFAGIPWSTDRVLERSLAHARRAGLEVRTLDPLADVDRLQDVPQHLLPTHP